MKIRFRISLFLILLGLGLAVAACSGAQEAADTAADVSQAELTLAPEAALTEYFEDAAPEVKEAYRFAIANPEPLSVIPCYCGCGAVGHKNNLQCYVKDMHPDGSVEFDYHAFG